MFPRVLLALVVVSFSILPLRADHPVQERGFRPDGVYQLTNYDSVNLFNGNLNAAIPIGMRYSVSSSLSYQLTLTYAGNLWQFIERCQVWPGSDGECSLNAIVRNDAAGLGWDFSFGTLSGGIYTSPSGAKHRFYNVLHDGDAEDPGDTDGTAVTYTRDGSYLRLRKLTATLRILEFPNGEKHRFQEYDSAASLWRLTHIYNGFSTVDSNSVPTSNFVAFTYPQSSTYSGTDTVITDSAGRSHTIRYKEAVGLGAKSRVASFDLAAAGGTRAIYTLEYLKNASGTEVISLEKPTRVTVTTSSVQASFLSKLHLPNGELFQFSYFIPLSTHNASGTLQEMILPTVGKIKWDYSDRAFAAASPNDEAVGVSARRVYDYAKSGSPQHRLAQYTTYTAAPGQNIVSTMTGWTDDAGTNARADYRTINYFHTSDGPETALPYTKTSLSGAVPNPDSGGRYLSTEAQSCTTFGTCSTERATYVTYERDFNNTCSFPNEPCQVDRNRRVKSERTLYVTDGSRWTSTDYSDFDGLGNYRTVSTNGNFTAGNVRTATTDYNLTTRGGTSSVGTYSLDANGNRTGNFLMLYPSDPWVLGTYTGQRITEAGITAHTQTCFDVARNFLTRRRQLKGTTPGVNDLLSVYTADAAGNVIREESFGSDFQTLSTASLCSMTLPLHDASTSRVDHTYQWGSLRTSQYKDTAGGTTGGLAFFVADRDIDFSTGLVIRSRDSAGIFTDYEYDTLGRLTWVMPQSGHDAWTHYDYRQAATAASGRAQVAVYRRANGSKSGTILARNSVEYDGLGRVYREAELLANNWWNTRDTRYDHAGRAFKSSSTENYVSDTAEPANWTTTTYDLFGRPRTITAPDGKVTMFTYTGGRLVSRSATVGMTFTGSSVTETSVTTAEEYDRQGRLWRVTEAAGTASPVVTEYTYDAGNRLSKVCSGLSGGMCTQMRLFTYDRRGLLASEQHPEKGVSGGGIVSYTYNARGLPLTRAEGISTDNFSLGYAYDRAGRLTEVRETHAGNRLVKQFAYSVAADPSKGKLLTATRYNHDRPGAADVRVSETYEYFGKGGRVSKRTTDVRTGAFTQIANFVHQQTWNDLGQPLSVTYPDCTAPSSCGGSDN
jgi:YD repeat-containing protein